jgi:site-specific DNA recombinase
MTKRAVIYARLSRNRTGEPSLSTRRQEAECRQLATSNGWDVIAVEVDDDVSAYSGKPRPGYTRLMKMVDEREVEILLAWAPDRLHRAPAELETFIDRVEAAKVKVSTVVSGNVDLSTPSGRMNARMLGVVARYESEHRSARTRSAHDELATLGRWKGGPRPYGYENAGDGRLEVVESEAAVIREAAERVIAGERVGSVANDLNRRGVATARGGAWRTPTLRRILLSHTVVGRRESKGQDIGPGQWPAILDVETSAAVRSTLAMGSKRGRVPRVALLTGGRCVCARCERPMSTARRQSGRRTYRCLSCFGQIAAEPLEELVTEAVLRRLDRAELPSPAPAPGISPIQAQTLAMELAALADDHGRGEISRAEWLAARGPLAARLKTAEAELARSSERGRLGALAVPGAAREAWPTLPLDRRQTVLDGWLENVQIAAATRRGPGFDDSRVEPRWRA